MTLPPVPYLVGGGVAAAALLAWLLWPKGEAQAAQAPVSTPQPSQPQAPSGPSLNLGPISMKPQPPIPVPLHLIPIQMQPPAQPPSSPPTRQVTISAGSPYVNVVANPGDLVQVNLPVGAQVSSASYGSGVLWGTGAAPGSRWVTVQLKTTTTIRVSWAYLGQMYTTYVSAAPAQPIPGVTEPYGSFGTTTPSTTTNPSSRTQTFGSPAALASMACAQAGLALGC